MQTGFDQMIHSAVTQLIITDEVRTNYLTSLLDNIPRLKEIVNGEDVNYRPLSREARIFLEEMIDSPKTGATVEYFRVMMDRVSKTELPIVDSLHYRQIETYPYQDRYNVIDIDLGLASHTAEPVKGLVKYLRQHPDLIDALLNNTHPYYVACGSDGYAWLKQCKDVAVTDDCLVEDWLCEYAKLRIRTSEDLIAIDATNKDITYVTIPAQAIDSPINSELDKYSVEELVQVIAKKLFLNGTVQKYDLDIYTDESSISTTYTRQ